MRRSLMFILEAQELLSAGKLQQVVEVCKRGLAYYPEHVSAYLFLAQAYIGLDQTQRALNVLHDGFRRTGSFKLESLRRQLNGEPPLTPVPERRAAPVNGASPLNGHHPETVEEVTDTLVEDVPSIEPEPETIPTEQPIQSEEISEIPAPISQEQPIAESEPVPDTQQEQPIAEPEPEPVPDTQPEQPVVAQNTPQPEPVAPARQPEQPVTKPLSLHTIQSSRRLRSANLRLIPGLEFAPLRHSTREQRPQLSRLIDDVNPNRQTSEIPVPETPETEQAFTATTAAEPDPQAHQLTPLEELAKQLENARIPIVEEHEPHESFDSPIVSETLADILVAQKAYSEALRAFQTLERTKPARAEKFRKRIREIEELMRTDTPNDPATEQL